MVEFLTLYILNHMKPIDYRDNTILNSKLLPLIGNMKPFGVLHPMDNIFKIIGRSRIKLTTYETTKRNT